MVKESNEVSKIAAKLALSDRKEEMGLIDSYKKLGFKSTAVDIGGQFPGIVPKIIENTLVASKRKGLILDCHVHDGAVAGAVREALEQLQNKANGLSIGGKIGISRKGEHISVAVFFNIGLLHLNEVVIALSHRSIPILEGEES